MATYGYRTNTDLSAFVGCWAVFTGTQRCALCRLPGFAADGIIVKVTTFGGIQWAQVDSGFDLRKVRTGGAYAAQTPITNDNLGRTVAAGVDDVVLGISVDASTGADQLHLIQPLSGNVASTVPSFYYPTAVDLSGSLNHFVRITAGGLVLSGAGAPDALLLDLQTLAGGIQYGLIVAAIGIPALVFSGAAFLPGVPLESDAFGRAVAVAGPPAPLLTGGILSRGEATAADELVICVFTLKP